jgi:hypothetical protein
MMFTEAEVVRRVLEVASQRLTIRHVDSRLPALAGGGAGDLSGDSRQTHSAGMLISAASANADTEFAHAVRRDNNRLFALVAPTTLANRASRPKIIHVHSVPTHQPL